MSNPTGKGGWVKGQSGNPTGRPKKAYEEKYYAILVTACTPDDWQAICEKACDQAIEGDSVARKFLADYLIGPPVQKQEHSGTNGGPIVLKVIYDG